MKITILFLCSFFCPQKSQAHQLLIGANASYAMMLIGGGSATADSYYLGPGFSLELRYRMFPFSSNSGNGIDFFAQYGQEIFKNTGEGISETNKLKTLSAGLDIRIKKFFFGSQFNYSSGSISGNTDVPSYYLTSFGPRAGVLLQIDQGLNFKAAVVSKFGASNLDLPNQGKVKKFIQEYAIEIGIEIRILSAHKYKKY